jgi:hypothetical protein
LCLVPRAKSLVSCLSSVSRYADSQSLTNSRWRQFHSSRSELAINVFVSDCIRLDRAGAKEAQKSSLIGRRRSRKGCFAERPTSFVYLSSLGWTAIPYLLICLKTLDNESTDHCLQALSPNESSQPL